MLSKRTAPVLLALLSLAATALAADDSPVVVTVGSSSMTTVDVTRRLAALSSYQVSRYGSKPEEIKKRFVEEVLVPEMLFGEEGARRKLDQTPAMRDKLRDSLRDAIDRSLKAEMAEKSPVTADDIKKYFEDNKSRYETPKRIRVWRIQVADEAAAKELIAQAKGTGGPKAWSDYAREKSLDKATAMRNGDLGFVRADGTTDVPRVIVNKGVFAAVDKVGDGALVPEPLHEGDRWSVLWRRGSVEATKRTLEDEEASIRQILERRRLDTMRQELLASLRKDKLKELHPELLSNIDASAFGPPRRDPRLLGRDRDRPLRRPRREDGPKIPPPASSD